MYKKGMIISAIVAGAVLLVSFIMTGRGSVDGHIIMTLVPVQEEPASFHVHGSEGGCRNARIVRINPERPDSSPQVLSAGFASAMSPGLSVDHQHLVFAGKKNPDENWRIWIMKPEGSRPVAITGEAINCFDPVFLPDDRIAFSCTRHCEKTGTGSTLYATRRDGTGLQPLTFHPHSDYAATVLHDGRMVMVTRQLFPEPGKPKLVAMRPDGTNAGLFFRPPENHTIQSKAREDAGRNIFFAAANRHTGESDAIIRFSYNNPYQTIETLRMDGSGRIHSLYPAAGGNLLVSRQNDPAESFGLYEYDPAEERLVAPVYRDRDYHAVEPVIVGEKPFIPKKLPTAVDFARDSGLLVFTENTPPVSGNGPDEAARSDMAARTGEAARSDVVAGSDEAARTDMAARPDEATKIQILGIDGPLSEIVPAADGSFYLEVAARTPVRLQRLNEKNEVLSGPTSWFWLMSGERRGFAGWDERRTIAPANRVPEAINHPPERITADPASDSFLERIQAIATKQEGL